MLGSAASSKEYPTVAASFTDTKSLYKWGFTHFKTKTVAKKGDTLAHIKVDLSTQTDQLVLTAKTDLMALLPADVETDSLEATPNLPEAVDAPIKAGDVVGSMTPLSPFCLKITFEKTSKKLLTSKKIYDNISELLFERFKKSNKK